MLCHWSPSAIMDLTAREADFWEDVVTDAFNRYADAAKKHNKQSSPQGPQQRRRAG